MANETNLKETITKAKEEKERKMYELKVAPMKADIINFIEKLKKYCLSSTTLEVRIIYRIKYESLIGFFGRPLREEQVIVPGWFHTEIEEEWIKLLTKWYFTPNGDYLIFAVQEIAEKNGFSSEYDDDGWGFRKEMICFTVK